MQAYTCPLAVLVVFLADVFAVATSGAGTGASPAFVSATGFFGALATAFFRAALPGVFAAVDFRPSNASTDLFSSAIRKVNA